MRPGAAPLPKVLALTRSDVSAEVRTRAGGGWLLDVEDPPLPEFIAGAGEAALKRAAPGVCVEIASTAPDGYTLHIRG